MNRSKSLSDQNSPGEPPPSTQYVEDEQEFDPREQLEVFWRRRWAILTVLLVTTVLGTLYTITRKPVFIAVTKLALVTDTSKPTSTDDFLSMLGDPADRNVETQVEVIKSPDLLDKAFNALTDQQRKKGFESPTIPTWCFSIDSATNSDVVSITGKAYSARIAAALANSIADTYLDQDLQRNQQSTHRARMFVDDQRGRAQKDLKVAVQDVADYKRLTGILDPTSQATAAATAVQTLKTTIETTSASLKADQRTVAEVTKQLKAQGATVPAQEVVQENPEYNAVRAVVLADRAKLNDLLGEYTEASPEVKLARQSLAASETQMRNLNRTMTASQMTIRNPLLDALATKLSDARVSVEFHGSQLSSANDALAKHQTDLTKMPEEMRKLAELQLKADILLDTYKTLEQKYNDLYVQENSSLPTGMIAARARPPQFAAYPQKTQNVIGFVLAGLLLGGMFAKLLERFDTRVHDPITVDRITGRPVLSVVPEVHPDKLAGNKQVLIGMVDNNHAFLESFRLLRNNIAFSAPDQTLRAIAVTSAGKGEGKSTTSVNLAIAMAMDGKRVLLIDGDLRRPTVHNYLDVSRDTGFTNVVKGLSTFDEAVVKTEYENVYVLPAGPLPPNPTEFLNSQQARRVLEEAKERYDLVLLDSPPCTGLSDVQVISTLVDGVVLVVALETTQKQYLMATMRLLRQADAPVLGTVINRVQHKRHAYGYYSYYYGYGYAYAYAYAYSYSYAQDEDEPGKKRKKRRSKKKDRGDHTPDKIA